MAFAVGCGKSVPSELDGISFSGAVAVASGETRAAGEQVTSLNQLQEKPFGIFGYMSWSGTGFKTPVFGNSGVTEVSYVGTKWTYSPKQKWNRSQHYRFRAFWPYSAKTVSGSDANSLTIDYSCVTDSYDLLVAYASRWPVTEGVGRVEMKFRHALSAVRFLLKFSEESTVDSDNLTKFWLSGLHPTGTLLFGSNDDDSENAQNSISWISNTFYQDEPMYEWTGCRSFTKTSAADVYGGVIFCIPQTLSSVLGATSVHFYTENGGKALHTAELPESEIEPGKVYTYTLSINKSELDVDVDVADWTETTGYVDDIIL